MKFVLKLGVMASVVLLSSTASAAPTIFFGENQNPGGAVSGAPLAARTLFLGSLSGVSTEDFEGIALGAPPIALTFTGSAGSINGSLTGGGSLVGAPTFGTFATSGQQFYDNQFNAFTVSFTSAIAAFGFYGTDVGDVRSPLEITLDAGLTSQRNFTVANTINGANASLLFWGVTDVTNPFTTVTFGRSGADRFGFDDLTVGDARQVTGAVPEPATWAMMLVGFGLIGATVRRRKEKGILAFA